MRNATHKSIKDIGNLSFIDELSKGILSQDKFIFYLKQDALYLKDYSKAIALTAVKLPNNQHMQEFMKFTQDAIQAERSLHDQYIQDYQLKNDTKEASIVEEQSPTCFMYTNYLLKMASLASVEEAVASLLPCFVIYNEIGKKMLLHQTPNNPYYKWINAYSSPAFETSVNSAINITNELAADTSISMQKKMVAAYVRSTQLEYLFWKSAYKKERWLNIVKADEPNRFLNEKKAEYLQPKPEKNKETTMLP